MPRRRAGLRLSASNVGAGAVSSAGSSDLCPPPPWDFFLPSPWWRCRRLCLSPWLFLWGAPSPPPPLLRCFGMLGDWLFLKNEWSRLLRDQIRRQMSENGTTHYFLQTNSIIADKGGREGRCIAGTSAELSVEQDECYRSNNSKNNNSSRCIKKNCCSTDNEYYEYSARSGG